MTEEEIQNLVAFKADIERQIQLWYTSCPKSLVFTSEVIKHYKKYFGKVIINESQPDQ